MIYATLDLVSIILPGFPQFMLDTVQVCSFRGLKLVSVAHVILGLLHMFAQRQKWQIVLLRTMQTVMGTTCA